MIILHYTDETVQSVEWNAIIIYFKWLLSNKINNLQKCFLPLCFQCAILRPSCLYEERICKLLCSNISRANSHHTLQRKELIHPFLKSIPLSLSWKCKIIILIIGYVCRAIFKGRKGIIILIIKNNLNNYYNVTKIRHFKTKAPFGSASPPRPDQQPDTLQYSTACMPPRRSLVTKDTDENLV